MKEYKRKLIFTSVVTALPMIVGLLLWNKLPDTMATHFGTDNTANGWSSKPMAVIGLPLFLVALHLITLIATLNDPKKKNISRKLLEVLFWFIPVTSLICCLVTYGYSLGIHINIGRIVNLLIGVLFLVLGNYMSKNRQNYTVGIKLPWTLASSENWNRTHRLASVLWILSGFAFIANAFLQYEFLLFIVIIVSVLIPSAYSFLLYKKGI